MIQYKDRFEATLSVHVGIGQYNREQLIAYVYDKPSNPDCADFGTIKICTHTVSFGLPKIDTTKEEIAGLEAVKEKIQAEAHMAVKEIDERIQNLLSITYQPEAAE